MSTSGLININNNTGTIFVPTPSNASSYSVSVYKDADSAVELARSSTVYLNGTSPVITYKLSASSNAIIKEKDLIVKCNIQNEPNGIYTVPYTISFRFKDGNSNLDMSTPTTDLTASDIGLTSLTGVFDLDYSVTPSIKSDLVIRLSENVNPPYDIREYAVFITLDNAPGQVVKLVINSNNNTLLTKNVDTISQGLSVIVTLTINKANGTEVPYTITGVDSSDIDVSLTGIFTVINNSATITITSLVNSDKSLVLVLDDNTAVYIAVGLKTTSLVPDGTIASILNHDDYLDTTKFTYFSSIGDAYYTPSKSLINLTQTPILIPNTIPNAIAVECYAIDLTLDLEGRVIAPGTKVEISLNKVSSLIMPYYSWTATEKYVNLESAAISLVASINATNFEYYATYLGTIGTSSKIRIYNPNYHYIESFAANSSISFYNFYVEPSEICIIPSGEISTNDIGGKIELVIPTIVYLDGTTATPNPYIGNSGVWDIKYVLGKYTILVNKQSKPDLVGNSNGYGSYTLV